MQFVKRTVQLNCTYILKQYANRAYKSFLTCTPCFSCCIGFSHILLTLPFIPLRNGYCTIYFTIFALTCVNFRGDPLRYNFFSMLKKPCTIRDCWVLCIFIEKMKRGRFATIPSFILYLLLNFLRIIFNILLYHIDSFFATLYTRNN